MASEAEGASSPWRVVVAPLTVVALLAAFYWAIFAPAAPRGEAGRTPTVAPLAKQPTQGPTLAATLTPMLATPTIPVLPVLALTTPSATAFPTPGPGTRAAPQFAPGAKATVFDTGRSGLNLRSDAGTSFPRVGSISEGLDVEIIAGPKYADGYTWYQVKDASGISGWAAANFLLPK
jgi:hypothetical protein